ncbi:MAG: TIM barrel protein [Verrucomicrobiota bacterium]|jgi:sugar phosphate isomerase/epimerase
MSATVQTNLSRRDFLAATLNATIGACSMAALNPHGTQAAEAPARAAKVRFGFTTYEWGKDWDLPTLIANLQKAQVFGVELRTSAAYAHGVELALSPEKRREGKKRFADSPITLLGVASGERMDWPEPEKLKAAIEAAKAHVKLSHDIGGSGVRVFPNQWHPNVSHQQTIEQIARALNEIGGFAADYAQEIRLEAHGPVGELPTLRAIMDRVTQPAVRIKLNSEVRDTEGQGFEANFNLVKKYLGHTLHVHDLKDRAFPYQLQIDLLVKMNRDG